LREIGEQNGREHSAGKEIREETYHLNVTKANFASKNQKTPPTFQRGKEKTTAKKNKKKRGGGGWGIQEKKN